MKVTQEKEVVLGRDRGMVRMIGRPEENEDEGPWQGIPGSR